MEFFENLFHTKKKDTESVVLIDIGADSVAGAYATFTKGGQPTLLYTRRLPVEAHSGEAPEKAMLRTFDVLGNALICEGAPALLRATGSGSAESIFVSIDAPWQKTLVRTEHFEQDEPFLFTKTMVTEALEKASSAPAGKILVDESIIGTTLNGYETRDPYGKKTNRAAIIVLTSYIDEHVAKGIQAALRSLYHTEDILPIAGSSLRYQAMRTAFPHERDALILDATGQMASLALVRGGMLVTLLEIPHPTKDAPVWVHRVSTSLKEISEQFPLPRTLFLLARESELESLREMFDTAKLNSLWPSDSQPKIVSVLGSHLSGFVRQTTTASPDLSMLLMAIFFHNRIPDETT